MTENTNEFREYLTVTPKNKSLIHEYLSFPLFLGRRAAKQTLYDIQGKLKKYNINLTIEELDNLEMLPLKTKIPFAWIGALAIVYEITIGETEKAKKLFTKQGK